MMKAIGSLFTLAGETLSAIGRMIERPAFNDESEYPGSCGIPKNVHRLVENQSNQGLIRWNHRMEMRWL